MKIDQIGTEDDIISCDICGEERPTERERTYECPNCSREGLDCCIAGSGVLCNDCEDIEQENYDQEYEYDEDDEDTEFEEDDTDQDEL